MLSQEDEGGTPSKANIGAWHLLSLLHSKTSFAMSTDAMKLELIEWLARLKDPGVLGSLLQWKKVNESADWYADLTIAQKASVERGLADAANGRSIPSSEVWKHHGDQAKG